MGQIQPKLLVTSDGYTYNGKTYSLEERVKTIVTEVKSLKHLVVIPLLKDSDQVPSVSIPDVTRWQSFVDKGRAEDFVFRSLPFNHPLLILYSSGTTGLPKCIVHGTGATLLQHHKEHALHTNIGAEDVVFFYTTCGWMVCNVTKDDVRVRMAVIDEDIWPLPSITEKLPADPNDRVGFTQFLIDGRVPFKDVVDEIYRETNEKFDKDRGVATKHTAM